MIKTSSDKIPSEIGIMAHHPHPHHHHYHYYHCNHNRHYSRRAVTTNCLTRCSEAFMEGRNFDFLFNDAGKTGSLQILWDDWGG